MSKRIDRYFIHRLEHLESDLRYEKSQRENAVRLMNEAQEKLRVLAELFEQTKSENGQYKWYGLKNNCQVCENTEAYKVIDELVNPEYMLPF